MNSGQFNLRQREGQWHGNPPQRPCFLNQPSFLWQGLLLLFFTCRAGFHFSTLHVEQTEKALYTCIPWTHLNYVHTFLNQDNLLDLVRIISTRERASHYKIVLDCSLVCKDVCLRGLIIQWHMIIRQLSYTVYVMNLLNQVNLLKHAMIKLVYQNRIAWFQLFKIMGCRFVWCAQE